MVLLSAGMYMVRASENGLVLPRFLEKGVAYIGWGDVGPVVPTDSKEDIRRRLDRMDPRQGPGARPNIVGMLRRFCCEIRVGDVVVTYDPRRREYHVGIVRSDAENEMTFWQNGYKELGYVRSIEWAHVVPRDGLSVKTRQGLNGHLSCYEVSEVVRRELVEACSVLPGIWGGGVKAT